MAYLLFSGGNKSILHMPTRHLEIPKQIAKFPTGR